MNLSYVCGPIKNCRIAKSPETSEVLTSAACCLRKELLLPDAEQPQLLREGQVHLIRMVRVTHVAARRLAIYKAFMVT